MAETSKRLAKTRDKTHGSFELATMTCCVVFGVKAFSFVIILVVEIGGEGGKDEEEKEEEEEDEKEDEGEEEEGG